MQIRTVEDKREYKRIYKETPLWTLPSIDSENLVQENDSQNLLACEKVGSQEWFLQVLILMEILACSNHMF